MALVKKTKLDAGASKPTTVATSSSVALAKSKARKSASNPRHQTIAERVAAATQQLASGLTQASAATKELGRSMEQIAGGAEEAAGASQEQSSALKQIAASLTTARSEATSSGRRAETVLAALVETGSLITASIRSIERNAERYLASVRVIGELEERAKDVSEITRTVSRISDQTNLLALNAAIEAARAGEHGRGFAVVAGEVRSLAEASDKSASEVQQLAETIQVEVGSVVGALKQAAENSANETKAAAAVIEALEATRSDMVRITEDSRATLTNAVEAERAAVEAGKGAEQIASAAEEQASGASEAQTAVQQQAKALEESQVAARALAAMADNLRAGQAGSSAAAQIGSAAEELSATIQELSSAASEVMAAIEEINRSCQLQASATEQTSAALAHIEKGARLAQENGKAADERVRTIQEDLKKNRTSVEQLINGVSNALQSTRATVKTVVGLEGVGRRIDKIVNAIALITVQTSMLAVSGAVEAARSGDSGRGFAVVSNDIRTLAREAAENVERAKDTVRGILDHSSILQRELDQIVISAEVEVQNNRVVLGSLEKIGVDVEALRKASQVIVDGSNAILEAATQAATGARQVAAAAEEASNATREAATAAAEQSQGAEDLAAAIEEIGSLADELAKQGA